MNHIKYFAYYTFGKLRRLYFMQFPEDEYQYKKSRTWFIVDGVTANLVAQLVGGAFLAFLLKTCGVSDALNGMITALATLACSMQFIGIEIAKRLKKHKLLVCLGALIHRLLFTALYFIPFFDINPALKVIIFTSAYLLAHSIGQIIGPPAINWLYSLIPSGIRGSYLGLRDIVTVGVMMVSNLIAGQIIDYYKAINEAQTGFIIVGLIVLLSAIVNFIALSLMKEPRTSIVRDDNKELHGSIVKKTVGKQQKEKSENFFVTLKNYITYKPTRNVIMVNVLWNIAYWFSFPYFGIYQISDLALSYVFIMGVGVLANIIRMIITPFFGKLADKKSFQFTLSISFAFMGISYLINSFCVPQNAKIMFVLFSVLTAVGWAGIPVGILGIQMNCDNNRDKTALAGIVTAFGGICAFLSALVGGTIMNFYANNSLFGISVFPQQILSFVSGLILLFIVYYLKATKVKKQ